MSATEKELQQTIIRAGFKPVKRDSDYNHLETVIHGDNLTNLTAPVPKQYTS